MTLKYNQVAMIPSSDEAANDSQSSLEDPDPFAIGFAILTIVFGGGAYLEARRQRDFLERQARDSFRSAWYDARRTLIHGRRVIEEFATYVSEDAFGTTQFLFGKVKLTIDRDRAQQLRRLHGNAHTTAQRLADCLDDLGDFLGNDEQPLIDEIHGRLEAIQGLPRSYDDLVGVAREALVLYERLVAEIGQREQFGA